VVHIDRLGRIGAQRAVGARGAIGGVIVERLLERGGLADLLLDLVGVGVDGAVEDHRSNLVGIGLGVGRSDAGAVRVAEIGQLLVAEPGAYRFEILGHIDGSDVGQELLAHLVHAALDELLVLLFDMGDALRGVFHRGVGAQPVVVRVGVTPRRRSGVGDAARIEADEIEPLTDRLRAAWGPLTRRSRQPDSPGPPGLMTSEPIFWPVALNRIIAIWATSPSGLE